MAKTGFAKQHLRAFVDRIERLNDEKDALTKDISEVYSEAKGVGFDTRILRQVIAKRKLDKADYDEQAALFDMYWAAVEFDSTPLGKSSAPESQNAPSSSKRDVSTKVEPSSEAGPQAEASHAGTGSETLAGPEGHISEGAAMAETRVADRRDTAAPPLMDIPAFLRRPQVKPPPDPVH